MDGFLSYEFFLLVGFLFLFLSLVSLVQMSLTSIGKAKAREFLGKLENDQDSGELAYKALQIWLESPNRILTTVLLFKYLVIIVIVLLTVLMGADFARIQGLDERGVIALSLAVAGIVSLIVGEMVPRVVANHKARSIFPAIIGPANLISNIMTPISWIIISVTKVIVKIFGIKSLKNTSLLTEEEIRALVSAGEEEGVLEKEEEKMIHSIFEFSDTVVKEVMIPRVDVEFIGEDATVDEILEAFNQSKHSRYPIYREKIDNVVGIIHIKDLFSGWHENGGNLKAVEFARPPYFVPESKRVSELLREFQHQKKQMAVVVDEYGGTAGVVTIVDLLEEIVGEMQDEYDMEEDEIRSLGNGEFLVDAKVDIDELNEELELNLPRENFETVGGLIFNLLEKIPEKGEEINHDGLKITIEDADERRISKVKIQIQKEGEEK